jgi:hypothetical protein
MFCIKASAGPKSIRRKLAVWLIESVFTRVLAMTNSRVLAMTNSRVLAMTNSRVLAMTNSRVLAMTNSRVLAMTNSHQARVGARRSQNLPRRDETERVSWLTIERNGSRLQLGPAPASFSVKVGFSEDLVFQTDQTLVSPFGFPTRNNLACLIPFDTNQALFG